MTGLQRLFDSTFPFVEGLLKKNSEFFPVASAIKNNEDIAQVGTYNGDEKPLSETVIEQLKAAFKAKQNEYKIIAIFYDVKVSNADIKTDAVAVSRSQEMKIQLT